MLAGTLVTIIGFMPVGFAESTAGEYAGNIFWIVGFALLTSWVVAVVFTPYLGVMLLPDIKTVAGRPCGDLFGTPRYHQLRTLVAWAVDTSRMVAASSGCSLLAVSACSRSRSSSSRARTGPRVLVEVQMPEGTASRRRTRGQRRSRHWLRKQPEAKIVTTYVGQAAPAFFLAYIPGAARSFLRQDPRADAKDAERATG